MALAFPNRTRSIDDDLELVRFSGYDGMFEVRFSMELDALRELAGIPSGNGGAYLAAFDAMRARIQDTAARAYRHSRKSVYRLAIKDFRS